MSLLTDAQQIKNETTIGANTAVRVGTLLENIVQDYDSKSKTGFIDYNDTTGSISLVADT